MIHKVTLTTQLVVPVIWDHIPVFPTSQLAQGGHFCALIRLLRVKKVLLSSPEALMDIERNPAIHYAYSILRI